MRKIPSTMATQHPDNAAPPYWQENGNPFIRTDQEIVDLLLSFQQFGVEEYMWDWEGKYADASIVEKLYASANEYFKENPIGQKKFVTFRLPNIWQEKGYSLMQALSVILAAEDYARDFKFKKRPLFEVILPMTESADQLLHMHRLYSQLASFKNKVFTSDDADNHTNLELIPLVESVGSQQTLDKLLTQYMEKYNKEFGGPLKNIRPFIACSDPALVSGWLATVLANKDALSQIHSFSKKHHVKVSPIAGAGSLPFRGGLSPLTVDRFMEVYSGLRTATIQSSFRFDYPINQVQTAIERLQTKLPRTKPRIISPGTTRLLRQITSVSEKLYQETLNGVLPDMKTIFAAVPKRRERRLHIGLLAYGRQMNKILIPRAITFTAGFYSLGVPPEFIGLGRTLAQLNEKQKNALDDILPQLLDLLKTAGSYINQDNLYQLSKNNKAWAKIKEDIELTESYFGIIFAPSTLAQKSHRHATSNVLLMKNNPQHLERFITESALLRKSLG